jgi:hypothetical protein
MSDPLSIACRDCEKYLWIGQSGGGGSVIYSRSTKDMDALEEFLYKHEGCELMFIRNIEDTIPYYTEIEVDRSKRFGWIRRLIRRIR